MTGATFPIVDVPPDAPGRIEQMGSKPKFWFRHWQYLFLYKQARTGSGEVWARPGK